MAVLLEEETAGPILKKQLMKLSKKGFAKFNEKWDAIAVRQSGNKNNIIVRGANRRDALVAEVVDENADTAIKNYVTAQGLIHRNGSLKFLERAEAKADRLEAINSKIDNMAIAQEKDFYPGGIIPEEIEA
jgi:hypothetical protein